MTFLVLVVVLGTLAVYWFGLLYVPRLFGRDEAYARVWKARCDLVDDCRTGELDSRSPAVAALRRQAEDLATALAGGYRVSVLESWWYCRNVPGPSKLGASSSTPQPMTRELLEYHRRRLTEALIVVALYSSWLGLAVLVFAAACTWRGPKATRRERRLHRADQLLPFLEPGLCKALHHSLHGNLAPLGA